MPKLLFSQAKIALVYDRVNTRYGGAEQVLLALHKLFPTAPLYTSVYDSTQANWAKDFQVIPSFLQNFPFAKRFHRWYVPLMPIAFESLDLREYDIVISITSAEAKGIITGPNTLHICYLLTPPRYLWSHHHQYSQGILASIQELLFFKLRVWDYIAGQRPDVIIPISQVVADRCQKYYRRTTQPVIYPPVNIELPQGSPQFKNAKYSVPNIPYYLAVSRLVPYKKLDLIIEACALSQQSLIIIGDGPEKNSLIQLIRKLRAGSYIQILSNLPPADVQAAYQQSQALILMAEEDFGIVALEAQCYGKPVIVYAKSGAAEVVMNGQTGLHIPDLNPDTLAKFLTQFDQKKWSPEVIQTHAQRFATQRFQTQFFEKIENLWNNHRLSGETTVN